MQRIVTDPAGTSWDVHVEWIGRRVSSHTMLGRFRRRWHERRHRKRALAAEPPSDIAFTQPAQTDENNKDGEKEKKIKWHDYLDVPDPSGCFEPDAVIVFILLFGVAVLIWFVGPFALALFVGLGEFALVLIAALGVFAWRAVTRKPWAVVARSRTLEHRWLVSGYRRARNIVDHAAVSLESGQGTAGIDPELIATPPTTITLPPLG